MGNLNSTKLLENTIKKLIFSANSTDELEILKIRYLGKNGIITEQLKMIGSLEADERRSYGQRINAVKTEIRNYLKRRQIELAQKETLNQVKDEKIDTTLPGRRSHTGALHPVTQTLNRIEDIFYCLGFNMASGNEIEDDYHNFEALNIPKNHPARAMHDTFYVDTHSVLRTHTSPVQIRYMYHHKPPIRIISHGRVYRRDSDLTHTPMFHQLEGLSIDNHVNFSDLKGILIYFLQEFFKKNLGVRFRFSYFPFTEPSAEVDISCVFCDGSGCRICKQIGWIEVLGCGIVHPKVFRHGRINPDKYTGYAFGLGVERLTMLRYGVNDIRLFFENSLSFLRQF